VDVPAIVLQGGDAMKPAPALEAHHAGAVLRVSADVAQHACFFPNEGTHLIDPVRIAWGGGVLPNCDGSWCGARMRHGPGLAAGQIPTLWIDSAEYRRNRRKQK
jgi:hypothetical protein